MKAGNSKYVKIQITDLKLLSQLNFKSLLDYDKKPFKNIEHSEKKCKTSYFYSLFPDFSTTIMVIIMRTKQVFSSVLGFLYIFMVTLFIIWKALFPKLAVCVAYLHVLSVMLLMTSWTP